MKKLSIVLQWVGVAALAVFLGYILWRPVPQPDYEPETWRNWDGVVILSYGGIARENSPRYPSVERMENQLTALKHAGYQTIRPEDLRNYLDERAPLPEKALLLIFEGGRKEAFIRATPVLQRTGFTAVISVPTTVLNQWGGFYLKPRDIRRVLRLPQWQVGSMGHEAIEPVTIGEDGREGHFLAHRVWGQAGVEEAEAFRARVLRDYARSAQILEEAAGRPALLYLYPFAEAGQSPGADPLAQTVNRAAVTEHFKLAVIGGSDPFNGPGSDPWSLTRLRVPGDWTPERLIGELASSRPRGRPQEAIGKAGDWVFEREGELRDSRMRLPPDSVAWLRGSDLWTDIEAAARIEREEDAIAALYARYTSPNSWVRVVLDSNGLHVQERIGGRLYTLYRRSMDEKDDPVVPEVRLRIRNNRAWVWLNEERVAENLPLSRQTRRGRVGLGAERNAVRVNDFSARPLPARWVLKNSIRQVPGTERSQVQAVVPAWFHAGETPVLAETARQDVLQSSVSGIRTIPLVTGAEGLSDEAATAMAEAIDAEFVKAAVKPLVPVLALDGVSFRLASELRNRHYSVAHLLSPGQVLQWGRSIVQKSRDEVIIVNGLGEEAETAIPWMLRVIPPSRIVRREADGQAISPDIATLRRIEMNVD